jgi:hypothetical protein
MKELLDEILKDFALCTSFENMCKGNAVLCRSWQNMITLLTRVLSNLSGRHTCGDKPARPNAIRLSHLNSVHELPSDMGISCASNGLADLYCMS